MSISSSKKIKINKVKVNCIYFLDANKIENYLGWTVSKHRPFICIHKENISGNWYYFFIYGTSQKINNLKVKNFSKCFIVIKPNEFKNKLKKITHFQTNLLYVIKDVDIDNFFVEYYGELIKTESKQIINMLNKNYENEIYHISFWNTNYNKWLSIGNGKEFIRIASKHPKKQKHYSSIIINKIKSSKNLSKDDYTLHKHIIKRFLANTNSIEKKSKNN